MLRSNLRVLLFVSLLPLLSSCGEETPSAPPADPHRELVDLARGLNTSAQRIASILAEKWLPPGRVEQALRDRHRELVTFVEAVKALEADPTPQTERLLERGRELREVLAGPFGRAFELLVAGREVVTRSLRIRRDLVALLRLARVPRDRPYGLRTRFEEGWLPENAEWVSDFFKGVQEVLAGVDSQRAPIAGKNLERSVASGQKLLREVQIFQRLLGTIDRRVERRLPDLLAYADRILDEGRRLRDRDELPAGVDAAALIRLEEARRTTGEKTRELLLEWRRLRPECLAGKPGAEASAGTLGERLQALATDLLRIARPLGLALSLPPPGSEKLK